MATNHADLMESTTTLASRLYQASGPRDANELWRIVREAQNNPAPLTRLQLMHTIQDNPEKLTLRDAFALLSSRLPVDTDIQEAWEALAVLLANHCKQP
jgi:hypothetical protein